MVATARLLPLLCVTALVIASSTASPVEREKRSLKHFFSRLFSGEDDEKEKAETGEHKSKEEEEEDKDDKKKHEHFKDKLKKFAHEHLKGFKKLKFASSDDEEKKKTEVHEAGHSKETGNISEYGSRETKKIYDETEKDVEVGKSAATTESDVRKKRVTDDKVTIEPTEKLKDESTLSNDKITTENTKEPTDEPRLTDEKDARLDERLNAENSKQKEFITNPTTEGEMLEGQKSYIGNGNADVKHESLDQKGKAYSAPQDPSKGRIDANFKVDKLPEDVDKISLVNVQRKKVYYDDEPTSGPKGTPESAIDSLVYGHVPDTKSRTTKGDLKTDGSDEDDVKDKGYVEESENESPDHDSDGGENARPPQMPVDGVDISGIPYLIAVRRAIALLFPELDDLMIEIRPVYIPTTVFQTDEDEAETEKKEIKVLSEVKKTDYKELEKEEGKEKKLNLEIPHAHAVKHAWGAFFPWMTVKEILWKIEEDMIEERQKAAEEAGVVLPVEFKDEVINIAGRKFLLKTKVVKSDPEERGPEFVSVVSILPFFEEKKETRTEVEEESRFRPPFLSSKKEPEELEKEFTVEKKADLEAKVKEILESAALEWIKEKKADEK